MKQKWQSREGLNQAEGQSEAEVVKVEIEERRGGEDGYREGRILSPVSPTKQVSEEAPRSLLQALRKATC